MDKPIDPASAPGPAPHDSPPSRRQVMAATLGGGFALAAGPVSAAVITTDAAGLEAGDTLIPSSAGAVPAYRALPQGQAGGAKTKAPLAIVVHEIFGVHEHIKDLCRRLAKRGFFAVAPQLFARQGDVAKITDIKELREKVVSKVPDAQVLSDLDATVDWAKSTGRADITRQAIIGFCWGGRIVWLYAAHSRTLKSGTAFYGRLVGDKTALQPLHPLDVAAKLRAPVLGLYGGQDKGIPLDTVEQMQKSLKEGGKAARQSEIKVYPAAGHAFFADYRPSYDPDAATDAWNQMLAWLKTTGVL